MARLDVVRAIQPPRVCAANEFYVRLVGPRAMTIFDSSQSKTALIRDEADKFQGAWKQISYERDGLKESLDDEKGWEPRTIFSGNNFVVTIADGSIPIKGIFKLDPTREPKAIDYTDTFGADAGKTFLAIYSLEGDELIFCAADEGHARPTEFKTKPGQVLRVNRHETPQNHEGEHQSI